MKARKEEVRMEKTGEKLQNTQTRNLYALRLALSRFHTNIKITIWYNKKGILHLYEMVHTIK